ncbi:MAG: hypothetical protein QXM27_02880 [Candidatus Pacearchaeota archaeon]
MSYLWIDLDSIDAKLLVRVLVKAMKLPEYEDFAVRVSSSGFGFLLKIYFNKEIDDFKHFIYRAILEDDPYRLRLALNKYYLGERRWLDLAFYEKDQGKIKEITHIVKKYEKDLKNIVEMIKNNENIKEIDKKINEVSKKLEKELKPFKKEIFSTNIGFKEKDKERIEKVCKDTFEKDPSFKYRIFQSFFPKYDYILTVYSPTKDQAFKRGDWLVKKALKDLNLLFWVKKLKTKV